MYQPLADELRPTTLDDVYGQEEILGEGRMLRRMIESGRVPNLIFYGPSGTGKTTVANIIAAAHAAQALQAQRYDGLLGRHQGDRTPSSTRFMAPNGVLLYLDEIQYVQQKAAADAARIHRKRQDHAHRVHDGKPVFLCLSTPSSVALARSLSSSPSTRPRPPRRRSAARVRYIAEAARQRRASRPEPGVLEHIAQLLRRRYPQGAQRRRGPVPRRQDRPDNERGHAHASQDAKAGHAALGHALRPVAGDDHYDDLSALMKSIRGSDPDAAIHYLARFLEVGRPARPPAAASCAPWRRTSALPIRRPSPSSRPASTALCSWACRRRVCRWPTPFFSLPRPRSPIPACIAIDAAHRRRAGTAEPASSRASCRTSTPTAHGQRARAGLSLPAQFPEPLGPGSSTSRT